MKYNLNKLASPFISVISPSEIFNNITNDIVEGIYPYYMISNFGRIYHKYTGKFLKPGWETSGYLFVALSTNLGPKNCLVHRLVMKSFNPIINHNELQVNHINGDKTCNILDNLESTCDNLQTNISVEFESRQKQYEYYRDKLLTFKELNESGVN